MIDLERDQEEQRLLKRYRTMMIESGAFPKAITDQELMELIIGDDKLHCMRKVTSLVPESYWKRRNL